MTVTRNAAIRLFAAVLILILIICNCTGAAQALSYQYNEQDAAVEAPDAYEAVRRVRSTDMAGKVNWIPADMFIDSAGDLYLLDQNDGCVYVFDTELNFKEKVIFYENGSEAFLTNLNGIYVERKENERKFYIADTENKRVFIADNGGNILKNITKPENAAFNTVKTFSPLKVDMDSNGNLYVLASGVYQGVCVFSAKDDYEFINFLGGNTIESTATVLADYIWKQIFNKTQIASMRRYVPVQCANFCIDSKDNVFTVTNKSSTGTNFENEIKKFNASNINIIKQQDWGDVELARNDQNLYIDTSYVDVSTGENGIIAAVDGNLCRIAVFTSQGDRLFTFGEKNNSFGGMDTPVAVEMYGQNIYVLDSHRQSITVYSPNEYGKTVLAAAKLHAEGHYEEAFPIWKKIISRNAGSRLAYIGMGKQYIAEKDYENAMKCFKNGGDREGYSQAFSLQRNIMMQKAFPVIAIVCITGFVLLLVLDYKLKQKAKKEINPSQIGVCRRVGYTLLHPCEGSEELARKTSVKKSLTASAVILTVWFFVSIIQWRFSGFIFNTNLAVDFNVWLQLGKTFGLFLLWTVSGWLVSNLMDSSARFSDLVVVSAVALIPYSMGQLIYTLLSNVISLDEGTYLTVITVVSVIWAVAVLWGGMREVNEMSFSKTLLFIFFTLMGMALIIFMMILLWSLFQQIISFASQIFIEFRKMIG